MSTYKEIHEYSYHIKIESSEMFPNMNFTIIFFVRVFIISSKSIIINHHEFLLIDVELSCDKQTSKPAAEVHFLLTSAVPARVLKL
jgi:hypothetical protein